MGRHQASSRSRRGSSRGQKPLDDQMEQLHKSILDLGEEIAGADRDQGTRASFFEKEVAALENRLNQHLEYSDEAVPPRRSSRSRPSRKSRSRHGSRPRRRRHKPRRRTRRHRRRDSSSYSEAIYELQKVSRRRRRDYSESYTYTYTYTYSYSYSSSGYEPKRKPPVVPRRKPAAGKWIKGDRSVVQGAGPAVHDRTALIDGSGNYGPHDRDVAEGHEVMAQAGDEMYKSEFADFDDKAAEAHAGEIPKDYLSDFAQFDEDAVEMHAAPVAVEHYRSDFVGYDERGAAVHNNDYKSDFVGYDDGDAPIHAKYRSDFAPLGEKENDYRTDFAKYGDNPLAYRSDFAGYDFQDDLLHDDYNTEFARYDGRGWRRAYETDFADFQSRRKKYRKRVRPRAGEYDEEEEDRIRELNEKMDMFSQQMAYLLAQRDNHSHRSDLETEVRRLERRLYEVQREVEEEVESYSPSYSYSYSYYSSGSGSMSMTGRPQHPRNFVYIKPQVRKRRVVHHRRPHRVAVPAPRVVYTAGDDASYSYSYYSTSSSGVSSTTAIVVRRPKKKAKKKKAKKTKSARVKVRASTHGQDDRIMLLHRKFTELEHRLEEASNRHLEQARYFERRLEDAEDQAEYVEKNVTQINRRLEGGKQR